jgi:hypothetical protein
MAIQDENLSGQPAGATGAASVNQANAPRPTTAGDAFANARPGASMSGQEGETFSFSNLGAFINSGGIGRTPASEVLTKLQKSLGAVYENANAQYEVILIPIDKNQTARLLVSVLVVAARHVENKGVVAYHTLILEGSVDSIPSKFEQINGKNVEILRTVSDANDAVMAEIVAQAVMQNYPQAEKLWNADATVVPKDFPIGDEQRAWILAANALYAAIFELQARRPNFVDLNLAKASRDETLVIRTAFPKTQVENAVGHPIRADIGIDLTVSAAAQNQSQLLESTSLVSRVQGFMDLLWDPVVAPQNQYANIYMPPQGPVPTQKYSPRLVLTTMENQKLLTLPGQLLALVTALSLNEGMSYVQAFRPSPMDAKGVDYHDIGAVAIEAGLAIDANGIARRIDTRAESFKPEHLFALIQATIQPKLRISLDVTEAGPDSWYNGVFAAAAEGNQKANQAIIEAANYLTNGAFQRHFAPGARVAIDEQNRIHMGYYIDRRGEKRDLRDIDYLAVLNIVGEKDLSVVQDWSDTFLKTDFPLLQRLAGRARIIRELTGDTAVFTGFAKRVTFEASFLEALAASAMECGLNVRTVQPYMDQASYQRATPNFMGSALVNTAASGLFNAAGAYGANFQGVGTQHANRTFNNRWY